MLIKKNMSQKHRGFTLTEAAIVLGIVGLILGAIWVAAASVYENLRVSTTSNQLLQIVQAVRSLHATQNTIDDSLSAKDLAKAGAIPSDMIVRSGGEISSVTDVWGGEVTIEPSDLAVDAFSITFEDVPQSACTSLLVRNAGEGHDSGLIEAGGVALGTSNSIPLSNAVSACGTGDAGGSVTFVFRLKT